MRGDSVMCVGWSLDARFGLGGAGGNALKEETRLHWEGPSRKRGC